MNLNSQLNALKTQIVSLTKSTGLIIVNPFEFLGMKTNAVQINTEGKIRRLLQLKHSLFHEGEIPCPGRI